MKRITLLALTIGYLMMGNVRSQDFSKLLDGYFAYNRFWGSVLITQDDKVLFSKSYGFADKDKKIMNDSNTLYNLQSLTKTMTATAIMKLNEDGKLNIYDRVDKYIPGFINDETKDIRIINLLNHTSGMAANLSQMDNQGNGMVRVGKEAVSMEALIAKFKETKLKHLPGTVFEYNNYGYVLLAYIIEKVSGMDYKDYLQKAIYSPAGMCNTFYQTDLKGLSSVGYEGIGSGSARVYDDNSDPSWLTGASNIYSSVTDLERYLKNEFSCRILSDKTLKIMLDTCVKSNFPGAQWTLGWIKQSTDSLITYSHSGDGDGYATYAGYIPARKISIIVLSNLVRGEIKDGVRSTAYTFVDEIAENVIKIFNNRKVSILPVPEGKADKKICGRYRLDESHLINVSFLNDSLYLSADSISVFDYIYNRNVTDNTTNVRVCKSLNTAFSSNNFAGFENYAAAEMKSSFGKDGAAELSGVWNYLTSTVGKYQSYSLYRIKSEVVASTYYMAYHFEKADILMELSFNNDNLISGFFITSILPKCEAKKIKMVAVGREEYFIDGYRYGGYKDYRVKFDKSQKILNFSAEGDGFNAIKI
jgi:CubicO group peptidase (beta-lactamase class C family)